jgi:hypothetical protein
MEYFFWELGNLPALSIENKLQKTKMETWSTGVFAD